MKYYKFRLLKVNEINVLVDFSAFNFYEKSLNFMNNIQTIYKMINIKYQF